MSIEGNVIKSFLVGLGFDVDETSLAKFNKSIVSAGARVTALYTSIQAAAAGIVYGIKEISGGFEQMGYEYHIIAPALNKALMLRQELLRAYSAAGINITKVIQQSIRLNISLEKTKYAFQAIYRSVGSRFFGLITEQSDTLRKALYANMPKIQNALERFVKFIFKAFEATVQLGKTAWSVLARLYDVFAELHKATSGWSTVLLAIIAAWNLLNLSFLATPLGALIAGLTAILVLFDDFKTWQEGGKSLFDWSSFVPVIDAVTQALTGLKNVWLAMFDVVGNLVLAFYQLFHGDQNGFFDSLKESAKSVLGVFTGLWDTIKGIDSTLGATLGWAAGLITGVQPGNVSAPNAQNMANPIGAGGANGTNQVVNQQTQIQVNSTADANSVGKAVAGQQIT